MEREIGVLNQEDAKMLASLYTGPASADVKKHLRVETKPSKVRKHEHSLRDLGLIKKAGGREYEFTERGYHTALLLSLMINQALDLGRKHGKFVPGGSMMKNAAEGDLVALCEFAAAAKLHKLIPEQTVEPHALCLNRNEKIIGYLMEKVEGVPIMDLQSMNPSDDDKAAIEVELKKFGRQLKELEHLHSDLHERNIMVVDGNKIKVIDPIVFILEWKGSKSALIPIRLALENNGLTVYSVQNSVDGELRCLQWLIDAIWDSRPGDTISISEKVDRDVRAHEGQTLDHLLRNDPSKFMRSQTNRLQAVTLNVADISFG